MMIYRIKTSLFAEEDKYGSYGHLLLKYFLAEGVMCNHSLFLASADTSTEHILKVNKYLDHKVIHTQSEESILLFLNIIIYKSQLEKCFWRKTLRMHVVKMRPHKIT